MIKQLTPKALVDKIRQPEVADANYKQKIADKLSRISD
jgi:hypothetical protein